jgi:hypothetical protein
MLEAFSNLFIWRKRKLKLNFAKKENKKILYTKNVSRANRVEKAIKLIFFDFTYLNSIQNDRR